MPAKSGRWRSQQLGFGPGVSNSEQHGDEIASRPPSTRLPSLVKKGSLGTAKPQAKNAIVAAIIGHEGQGLKARGIP